MALGPTELGPVLLGAALLGTVGLLLTSVWGVGVAAAENSGINWSTSQPVGQHDIAWLE